MSITYKWTDASERFMFKIENDIYTTFRVAYDSEEKNRYLIWLDEGNTPEPADE